MPHRPKARQQLEEIGPRSYYTRIAIPLEAADELRRAASKLGLTLAAFMRYSSLAYARAGLNPAPKSDDPSDAPPRQRRSSVP